MRSPRSPRGTAPPAGLVPRRGSRERPRVGRALARHLSEQELHASCNARRRFPATSSSPSRRLRDGLRGAGCAAPGHRSAAGGPGSASIRVGRRLPDVRRKRRRRQPAAGAPPVHHAVPEDLPLLATDPFAVRSQAYDLCSTDGTGVGSVRIHRRDIQETGLRRVGDQREEAEARFGFLLGAFRYGAPAARRLRRRCRPAGGDPGREENIREVIAYPRPVRGRPVDRGADGVARRQPGRIGHPVVAPPSPSPPASKPS